MIKEQQERFYKTLGHTLTVAMERRRLTVAKLSSMSGEHHKTIRGILEGRPCSLHHAVWLKDVLNIDVNEVARSMEGMSDKEERGVLDELV